jgi:ParB family chromosome partitioning protein
VADNLILIDPKKLNRNPDNPRLIFHQEELDALEESIGKQGILVPLTVYKDGNVYRLLDGERRWRCALKLGLKTVPVISQPKPGRLQNIMMMFAIHNARRDWDPLPTALKLKELEEIFSKQQKRNPTEKELAELASLKIGEVRRLKKLLALPEKYRLMLMKELEKPRLEQQITVDHVIEATKGAEALRKRGIIDHKTEDKLRTAILQKYRSKIIKNTVAPRQLAKISRAVQRKDVSIAKAASIVQKIIEIPTYSVDDAYQQIAKKSETEHQLEQLIDRMESHVREQYESGSSISPRLKNKLKELIGYIEKIIRG